MESTTFIVLMTICGIGIGLSLLGALLEWVEKRKDKTSGYADLWDATTDVTASDGMIHAADIEGALYADRISVAQIDTGLITAEHIDVAQEAHNIRNRYGGSPIEVWDSPLSGSCAAMMPGLMPEKPWITSSSSTTSIPQLLTDEYNRAMDLWNKVRCFHCGSQYSKELDRCPYCGGGAR